MLIKYLDKNIKNRDKKKKFLCKYEIKNYMNLIEKDFNNNLKYLYYFKQYNINSGDNLENHIPQTIDISANIINLNDLIDIIKKNPYIIHQKYNIDLKTLHTILPDLIKLNNMIGMKSLKIDILNQILYYIQNLHNFNKDNSDFMHTVLFGPPGTGKTEIAKIIGSIFSKMKILKNNTFKKVTRSDLVAGFLGQTALKTKHVIESSLGGVLFIDEAYALGNNEKKDSFAKECIDTLCEALSDHKDNLMVIIAGYEDELNNCFFNFNPGLQSRFVWRYKTEEYKGKELLEIYLKKVYEAGWSIANLNEITEEWFQNNIAQFNHYGRSMEILFTKTKIAHSRRVFSKSNDLKKKITLEDLNTGYTMLNKIKIDENYKNMYN